MYDKKAEMDYQFEDEQIRVAIRIVEAINNRLASGNKGELQFRDLHTEEKKTYLYALNRLNNVMQ